MSLGLVPPGLFEVVLRSVVAWYVSSCPPAYASLVCLLYALGGLSVSAIDKYDEDAYAPIFLCFTNLFALNDALVSERVEHALPKLLATMEANVKYERAITSACRFVLKLTYGLPPLACPRPLRSRSLFSGLPSNQFPAISKWMLLEQNRKHWAWTEDFGLLSSLFSIPFRLICCLRRSLLSLLAVRTYPDAGKPL